jgi:hypothetical protein
VSPEQALEALELCHGNKRQAAESLGIHRTQLYRLLKRAKVEPRPTDTNDTKKSDTPVSSDELTRNDVKSRSLQLYDAAMHKRSLVAASRALGLQEILTREDPSDRQRQGEQAMLEAQDLAQLDDEQRLGYALMKAFVHTDVDTFNLSLEDAPRVMFEYLEKRFKKSH